MKDLELEKVVPRVLGRSQKGQDSYIDRIFSVIPPENKFFVEFGAVDGEISCNTWYLKHYKGWTGLWLDRDYHNPSINLFCEKITSNNIVSIFEKYKVPSKFDFLSIDIDGIDYWVLESILGSYQPSVIMIETNVRFDTYEVAKLKNIEDFQYTKGWYGASPYAINKMAENFGYKAVYLHLDDLFLVRKDKLSEADLAIEWKKIHPRRNIELYNDHNDFVMNKNNWVLE